MSVLVFERKVSKGFYRSLAEKVCPRARIVSLSDFRNVASNWVGDYIYNSRYDRPNELCDRFSDEIIARCRFLRFLPRSKAELLSRRVCNGIEELFDAEEFDAVFQGMVDNYTLDIVERIANSRGVPVVSFCGHFFPGYFRITTRGEFNELRSDVSNDEVRSVKSAVIKPDYRPSFELMAEKSPSELRKIYYRRKFIEELYYPFMKLAERDGDNYHYNTLLLREGGRSRISKSRYEGFFAEASLRNIDLSETVYLPLHMIPEATTDYWCRDVSQVRYEEAVLEFIRKSDRSVVILVKEHPSMDGWRDPSFYKKLMQFDNVVLLPPHLNSNGVVDMVDAVVVHTGSVGVEALMRGKKAYCLTENYYSSLHPNAIRVDRVTLEMLRSEPDRYSCDLFVSDLLKGLWKGRWYPGRGCREKSTFEALVASAKSFLDRRQVEP